jgi:hypothetical protein
MTFKDFVKTLLKHDDKPNVCSKSKRRRRLQRDEFFVDDNGVILQRRPTFDIIRVQRRFVDIQF